MENDRQDELIAIVDEFLMLLCESADYQSNGDVRAVLTEAGQAVATLRQRLSIASDRYIVAVVGLSNVGKSTLLNALLGSDLAPRRNGPCTPVPIEFSYGENLRVVVHHSRSMTRSTWRCENMAAIQERLAAVVDDAGESQNREVRKIVVEIPVQLLEEGLVIADTPGFGALQSAEAGGSHEVSLKRYLQEEVAQVFWVVLADQGIGKREKLFHERFFGEVCDDIVVTGSEDWEPSDKERFKKLCSSMFPSRMPRFHFVSGLMGLRARKAGDLTGLEAAGITLLEGRLRELTGYLGRIADIEERLHQIAADLGAWCGEQRRVRRGPGRTLWRPDSWSRWLDCVSGNPFKIRLSGELGVHE